MTEPTLDELLRPRLPARRGELMADWWRLRTGSALVYFEWGHTSGTLHATDFKMHKGPPVTIAFNLEKNLRIRAKGVGTRMDAEELAGGEIGRIARVDLSDEHVLSGLRRHLTLTRVITPLWRLVVTLHGTHEFDVRPEDEPTRLILRVVEPKPGRG